MNVFQFCADFFNCDVDVVAARGTSNVASVLRNANRN